MATAVTAESLGLSEFVFRELRNALSRHPMVRRASVFGSRGRGEFTNRSDIDLLLDAPDMTFTEYLDLLADIDNTSVIFNVDVIRPQLSGNDQLLGLAERDCKLIWPE
jgi:predicted nucleotidyltransferase